MACFFGFVFVHVHGEGGRGEHCMRVGAQVNSVRVVSLGFLAATCSTAVGEPTIASALLLSSLLFSYHLFSFLLLSSLFFALHLFSSFLHLLQLLFHLLHFFRL